jgi:hypothetical protein
MKKAPPFLPRSALFITLGFNIDMAVEKIKGLLVMLRLSKHDPSTGQGDKH